MQAVILAGGKGTRLAERLNGHPKPLVDVNGVPLLERQLNTLALHGVDDVVVLVNHAADQIEAFFASRDFGCRVRLIDDGEPRGTAGALLACLDVLADRFLVVYGDTLFDIDIAHMVVAHAAAGADATLLLHPNDHPADSDLVELDEHGAIRKFHSYPHPEGMDLRNLVNAAFYIIEKQALLAWRGFPAPCDFAKDLFPAMLEAGARLHGYVSFEYIKDLGTPKRLEKVERHLRSGVPLRASRSQPQKAVFIDRDGTLNQLRDYVRTPEALELLPGAADAVHRLNDAEYRVVLATNQPVIARGECTVDDLRNIHNRLESRLGAAGAYLDALYYCPHHPDGGFSGEVAALKIACDCRKPAPGMMLEAMAAMNIRAASSWMIGDSTADMLAADRAGLKSILVRTGEGGRDGKYSASADFIVDDVGAAAAFIIDAYPHLASAAATLVDDIAPGELVLVGGLARSGKSTLAGVLKAELEARGRHAVVVSADRWILPEGERGAGVLGRFALGQAEATLTGWLGGEAADIVIPTYDRVTRRRGADAPLVLTRDVVLILEGVPVLLAPWSTRRQARRLYVKADEDARRERVIADLITRGLASPQEAARVYAQRQIDEAAEVEACAPQADQIFNFDAILGQTLT